jgi:geranylgeranyl pyrophosphate synthase
LAAEGQALDGERVDYIHRHKTGDLLRASVRMGGISAGASPDALNALDLYGDHLGLAFQVMDDILNVTADPAALGKGTGTDAARGKLTYVAVHGLDGARQRAADLVARARQQLQKLPGDTAPLRALADYVINRAT